MAANRIRAKVLTKKLVTVEGIPELKANAERLMRASGYQHGDVAEELKHVTMRGGLILRDEIRDTGPYKSGTWRSGVFAAYGDPTKPDVLVGINTRVVVSTSKSGTKTYAGVIEFGDATHPPQAPMRRGIAAARPTVARVYADGIRDAIEAMTKRLIK